MQAEPPQQLNVYPNPSTGYIILEYNLEVKSDAVLEITNMSGNILRSISTTEKRDQVIVTTKNWKPGLYIVDPE